MMHVMLSHTLPWVRWYTLLPTVRWDILSPASNIFLVITGDLFKFVHPIPPPVLTASGGHQNTYGWQAGGTYPTGMLSCWLNVCVSGYWMDSSLDSFNSLLAAIYHNFLVEDFLQQLQTGVWRFQPQIWMDHLGQPRLPQVLDAWRLLPGRTKHDQTLLLFPESIHAALQEWHFGHKSKVCLSLRAPQSLRLH